MKTIFAIALLLSACAPKAIIGEPLTPAVARAATASKADAAYAEVNNVNVKLESLGIQTKPTLGESSENPVHTVTP